MAMKKSCKKTSARCAANVVDKKTGKKRKCKSSASGRSKYCSTHKK